MCSELAANLLYENDRKSSWKPYAGYRPAKERDIDGQVDGLGVVTMSDSVEAISVKYPTTKKLSGGTRKEYKSTVTKWRLFTPNGAHNDDLVTSPSRRISRRTGLEFHGPIMFPVFFKNLRAQPS